MPAGLRPNRRETPCALQGLLPEKAAAEPDRTDMVWRFEQANAEAANIGGRRSDPAVIAALIAGSPQNEHSCAEI
ncbi:hypothetical protein FJ938_25855 [Mesorhizobium sp. B2-4-14]|uniref:hypothetical protein n=1 Tax=Mesorhizobium sp. B2-4-14 TaxID=2589935 RepID=UPI001128716B|nr:hypothetical protein [Mesorhizobium sp. B2-4-14]TPK97913.1 hypothetical protein FJ938_25855 [Mesorhizobium sp. B2-4-14]